MTPPPNADRRTTNRAAHLLRSPLVFAEQLAGIPLRAYQQPVAEAIIRSVMQDLGHSIVVVFPRQSGKNQLQALLEAYLLTLFHEQPAEIVKISPTARPQSHIGMRRLEHILRRSQVARGRWSKESGYIYRLGLARIYFLSGAPDSNIVGATASLLLEVDEAQDVEIDKYDREIAPMVAASNATRVFWGTAWTSRTLLARELRLARLAEAAGGDIRSFVLSAGDIAPLLPSYARFVDEQIARLGRDNPLVKTQLFSEEIDSQGGMFNPARRALMQGAHPPQIAPAHLSPPSSASAPALYAFTLDIAGEDESARQLTFLPTIGVGVESLLTNPARDATALTIFEIDTASLADPLIARPTYRVVNRQQWIGVKHAALFARLAALIDLWQPLHIVIDATGIGQTLASFLLDRYPTLVLPFVFTSASKSQLGWDFLTLIETGRYKEYAPTPNPSPLSPDTLQSSFWRQVELCQYTLLDGPGQLMRWGVPDGTRDPATGDLVHDDLLISAALISLLDDQPLGLALSHVLPAPDPFLDKEF